MFAFAISNDLTRVIKVLFESFRLSIKYSGRGLSSNMIVYAEDAMEPLDSGRLRLEPAGSTDSSNWVGLWLGEVFGP
jgi:hypothetical protein